MMLECQMVEEKRDEYHQSVAYRDDMIREARDPSIRMSVKNLVQLTGLSAPMIKKIEDKPYSEYYDGPFSH